MSKIATLLIAALTASSALNAQDDRGLITGTVTDQAGAVISNAQVTALNIRTNTRIQTTNEAGEFTIPSLPVGEYRVTIEPGRGQRNNFFDARGFLAKSVAICTRYSTPNNNISSTSFGQVTAQASSPRNLQLAMKLIW